MGSAQRVADGPEPFPLTVAPFDHSRGVAEYTGMRGVKLDAPTGYQSTRVFSVDFPTVFVTESGEVEVGETIRVPRATAAAWFRAVADYLEPVAASSGEATE